MSSAPPRSPRSRPSLPVLIVAILFVVVPFLFWYQTWFGRRLSDQEIGQFLDDSRHGQKIQHALAQVSERMAAGDPRAKNWYPRIVTASQNPAVEVRTTAAWTMGQDTRSELLHAALLRLLNDPEPLVRRNAALALVRFGDARARPELVSMLQPYVVRASAAGTAAIEVRAGQEIGRRALVARVRTSTGRDSEVRSPLAGTVERLLATNGTPVEAAAPLLALVPDPDQVWESLRALYLVGGSADLSAVEPYTRKDSLPDRIRQQALLTARAIRTRPEPSPTR